MQSDGRCRCALQDNFAVDAVPPPSMPSGHLAFADSRPPGIGVSRPVVTLRVGECWCRLAGNPLPPCETWIGIGDPGPLITEHSPNRSVETFHNPPCCSRVPTLRAFHSSRVGLGPCQAGAGPSLPAHVFQLVDYTGFDAMSANTDLQIHFLSTAAGCKQNPPKY